MLLSFYVTAISPCLNVLSPSPCLFSLQTSSGLFDSTHLLSLFSFTKLFHFLFPLSQLLPVVDLNIILEHAAISHVAYQTFALSHHTEDCLLSFSLQGCSIYKPLTCVCQDKNQSSKKNESMYLSVVYQRTVQVADLPIYLQSTDVSCIYLIYHSTFSFIIYLFLPGLFVSPVSLRICLLWIQVSEISQKGSCTRG